MAHEKILVGKHMVILTEVPKIVVHRFPHLGDQIVARAARMSLKVSLGVEILERLTRLLDNGRDKEY